MYQELCDVCSKPIYICLVAGYAAQTASLNGISTFGSSFLMGLGYFDTETDASTTFGIVVSLAGILGTLLGGLVLDRFIASKMQKCQAQQTSVLDEETTIGLQLKASTSIITMATIISSLLLWSAYFVYNKVGFLMVIAIGCAVCFLCTPGINVAIMKSVDKNNRSFAIAMSSVAIHALGDVPSPVIAGILKDRLASSCVGVDAASSQCRQDAQGLRKTMLLVCLWLVWTILFFSWAYYLSKKLAKKEIAIRRAFHDKDDSKLAGGDTLRQHLLDTSTASEHVPDTYVL